MSRRGSARSPRSCVQRAGSTGFCGKSGRSCSRQGWSKSCSRATAARGQDPCPPALLAMVMLLQRCDALSDADAVEAADNDRRWQLVLGTLGTDGAPFGQGTLVRFRTRMMAYDLDKRLVDRRVELAKQTGKFGWKKLRVALDSSPLHGAGRVEDTWNLIGRAMSKVVHAVSHALCLQEDDVIRQAGLTVLSADSIKPRSTSTGTMTRHSTKH